MVVVKDALLEPALHALLVRPVVKREVGDVDRPIANVPNGPRRTQI